MYEPPPNITTRTEPETETGNPYFELVSNGIIDVLINVFMLQVNFLRRDITFSNLNLKKKNDLFKTWEIDDASNNKIN